MKPDPSNEPEEDFWDLEDDELDLSSNAKSENEKSDESTDSAPEEPQEEPSPEETPASERSEGEEATDETPEEEAEAAENAEEAPSATSSDSEEPSSKESSFDFKGTATRSLAQLSALEKASLVAVMVLLIGAASWGLSIYFKHAPEGTLVIFAEDFPIEGEHTAIAGIETFWRTPVRKGENADRGVQLNSKLIPCARIKLTGPGNASLALSFQNSEKELVGDPITLEVENGQFVKSGTNEIVINSTAGFRNPSTINAYTNGDLDPWSLLIVEGAPDTNPSYKDEDKKLAEARISPTIQE